MISKQVTIYAVTFTRVDGKYLPSQWHVKPNPDVASPHMINHYNMMNESPLYKQITKLNIRTPITFDSVIQTVTVDYDKVRSMRLVVKPDGRTFIDADDLERAYPLHKWHSRKLVDVLYPTTRLQALGIRLAIHLRSVLNM